MITINDFKFHERDVSDRTWTETLFIIFSNAEHAVSGNIYCVARPNMGVIHSSIEIHKGFSFQPWQIDHNDAQMHLPCPQNYSDFTLENGLSFKAHSASELEWHYKSLDGNCEVDLSFEAVCRLIDTHDPEDNPQAGQSKVQGYDGWNNGHMEGKGQIEGRLLLHGQEYDINCVDGINKSWGPRNDWGSRGASWIHVDLGKDLNAFLVLEVNFDNKEMVYGPFKYGYIVKGGERQAIVNARMKAERKDMLVTRVVVEMEDDNGEVYVVRGTSIAGAPWYNFNPATCAFQTLIHWESGKRSGYSHIADFVGHGYLSRGMADKHSV
jgi:hypothetical protein|tara:strand:+ start:846 stop:1817 length:972 start_codon:yes stop_codon:yes gene_type:complete